MPQTLHPRHIVGDARIDLDDQYGGLLETITAAEKMDEAWKHARAHILRRAATTCRRHREEVTA